MSKSLALFQKALQHIPGGVNSPVRSFKGVHSTPFFIDYAKGAHLRDVDGNTYLDFVNAWGAILLGHSHPVIEAAIMDALKKGISYGIPHPAEIEFASLLSHLMPSMEKVRLLNSGTEATMTAVRLARGYSRKQKIIKFEGCYHGASESLLVKAGSGIQTLGIPDSAGIPEAFAQETLVARFNDLTHVNHLFEQYPDQIAGIIIEPIVGNMNMIQPLPLFLQGLRKLCDTHNSILIFDEVMTGFRVALGGAQALYQIKPDLTTLSKIIGGGLPLAALGGRSDIMDHLTPQGSVYQAGTFSGNPIAIAAGLATLKYLRDHSACYETLNQMTHQLIQGLSEKATQWQIPFLGTSIGGMFGLLFTDEKNICFHEQIQASQTALFLSFFHGMLKQGIYFAPSRFEAGFISLAHTHSDIDQVVRAADSVFRSMTQSSPL